MKTRNAFILFTIMLAGMLLVSHSSLSVRALTTLPAVIIDDFNDGDISDWGFFGGNAAGGGGGPLADRPYEGAYYLSTGWGGGGSASVFYGGFFRNFDNGAQVVPPADPWFNVWVLNQSDATVDAYTLEITLREDTNGDGWVDGSEDSVRLDTSFTSAAFNDEWTLISAPVSSFVNQGTGGDGAFDGNLDEVVIVVAGVQGADGATVEVDFDQLSFTSGGPVVSALTVFDDMEHGDPLNNGWFTFGGAVGGGGIDPNDTDLPPVDGGAFSLQTGWGSGGVAGFYGGFGRTNPTDLTGTDTFNFWINPDAGQDYTLEINLQDDDTGDNIAANTDNDDEFQYNCVVSAAGPCAISGGGWQLVSIPLADFFDDNSFYTAGNGILDAVPTANGGNGQLISVVFAVIGTGSDVNFRTDYWVFDQSEDAVGTIIENFESGVAPGTPCPPNLPPLGFCTFNGAGSSVALSNPTTPPAPELPAIGTPNSLLQMDVDVTSFAGFIQGFTNAAGDTWIPQDWSTSEGISFWMYGANSGTAMFIDILDNRNPDSTVDDAERWTVAFTDDFTGWQLLEFPFASFTRKEIGNGAPNDGLGLFEMHGYALGTLGTGGPQTYYFDNVSLYGIAEPPAVAVQFSVNNTFIEEGTTGQVGVRLNRALGPDDPAEVSIDYATERSYATAGEEYTPASGTLTFVNGGATELFFDVETFDDTKFEGDEQIIIRLTNPVGVERGPLFQGSVLIDDNDPFDPELLDDFEQGAFLWDREGLVAFEAQRVEAGDTDERPEQDQVENILTLFVSTTGLDYQARIQNIIDDLQTLLPASDRKTTRRIERAIDYLEDAMVHEGSWKSFIRMQLAARELVWIVKEEQPEAAAAQDAIDDLVEISATLAQAAIDVAQINEADQRLLDRALREINRAEEDIANGRGDKAIGHYRRAWSIAYGAIVDLVNDGVTPIVGSIVHDFPLGQDWTGTESLDFWFNGTGSGEAITVVLKDNRAPDPGPSGWNLVWSDEFDEPAGTPPKPENWSYEIGDVTPDGKNGWGNEELQYYTDDPANAATDGNGNLVITLDEADSGLECYYGPCEYESARLISLHKAEFAYGRIESRLLVPDGGDGLWPAFWSLGTDITYNPWPGAGEIDFMEYVSRLPNEIFGTVHGPGYNGGGSIGGIYDFGQPVYNDYHTFTVEWEPNLITWYVDGIQYHQVTPADVPGPWVFEKPFFLLLNFAIGGNFGGAVDPDNVYPQEYLVDYIRVYQGPDTAERFEATFTDAAPGWQEVSIPMTDFTRSANQPDGAPDDGLSLNDVWGYGFEFPYTAAGDYQLDLVRRTPFPPPTDLVVTNLDDSGAGSLREALTLIADDGTITLDSSLAGGTLTLTSGQLVVDKNVTIAGAGVTISGNNASRVLQVAAGANVSISDMTITEGAGAPQGGGILNFGTLNLDTVTVSNNTETSAGPASFDLGGGGIYNGDGATLNLTNSAVSDNSTVAQPGGGVYGFFNSTINVTNSTISGNISADVAGGLRTLGNANIVNSTISGNTSTAWHGGALFSTDGAVTIVNATIVDNNAPGGTAGGLMVATFGAPVAVTVQNSIVANNGDYSCQVEGDPAVAVLTSLGNNVFTDGSCAPVASDQVVGDAGVDALANNGGPTLTHALLAGSPAIDAANTTVCPATDQRGVARDAACDVGAYEFVP